MILKISGLKVSVDNREIIKGLDLVVGSGEMHVLMGPNGSGKSTLAKVLAGSFEFIVHSGLMNFNGRDLKKLSPDKRAKLGIFLGFQHPVEVPGVSVFNMLRRARQSMAGPVNGSSHPTSSARSNSKGDLKSTVGLRALDGTPSAVASRGLPQFREELLEYASSLKLSDDFLRRSLNEGFSGGEKKRNEILQMMALKPRLAILDEIDSGLDVDGLRIVAESIKRFAISNKRSAIILITHYARILKYLKPDFVHVMVEGRIVRSGQAKLAKRIEEEGYQFFSKPGL